MMVQTEIGLLPEDWEVETLENIGSFTKGSGISRSDSLSGRIPAVRYGELYTDHDNYIKTFHSFISPEVAKTSKKMKQGCILFTASGETKEDIGKAVAFLDDFEAYAGGDLIILNPKGDYSSQYLGYTLNSPSSVRQRAMMAQGDSVVHITTGSVQKVTVPIPSSTEQQNIASALSSIDKLIDDLGRTIQKKQRIREGAMEELLSGKKRLHGFTEEWVESKLNQYGKMIRGVSYKPEQAFYIKAIDSTPLLRSNNVQNGKMVYDDVVFVLDVCINKQQYMQQGDILICTANGSRALVGKSALFNHTNVYTFGAFMGVLRCNDVRFSPYIFYLLQTKRYKHKIDDVLAGSAINNLNSSEIEEITFMTPSNEKEAFAIADILTSMDDEISLLESERAKYEQIRSGMMEELLTGKKRLIKK